MARLSRVALAALAALACASATGPDAGPPRLGDDPALVVFVGNSLTFTWDVPGLVQAMADADGRPLEHVSIALPARSLEDHWNTGAPDRLRELAADMVVLQQGPSTLPANREHLIHWTRQFATVIREAGGEPALFMVWPSVERRSYFDEVWLSYREAADAVGGLFIPAGQTWVEAWAIDPELELYGPDGVHQSYLGALAAARTIYASLYGLPADSVPALDDGVDGVTLATLREALARSLRRAGY